MLEEKIGYSFKDKTYLNLALTHKSFSQGKKKIPHNERLEFLGDSILGFSIANYLFLKYPQLTEGELTKLRAIIVCEKTLFSVAKSINLGEMILMGKGEAQSNGRNRPSILSDALEALFAAIYLDSDLNTTRDIIINLLKEHINDAISGKDNKDFKTILQEVTQKEYEKAPTYNLILEEGPDHDKSFTVEASLNNRILGIGVGKTKKEAEKQAAKIALEKLNKI